MANHPIGVHVGSDPEEGLLGAAAAMDADDAGQHRMAPVSGRDHEDTILWRMRRNSPHLFSDGVAPTTTP